MKVGFSLAIAVTAFIAAAAWSSRPTAQAPAVIEVAQDGPQYTTDGKLIRPANYREWQFVTAGLGMTYGPAANAAGRPPRFDNVFVNPSSYRSFMQTGKWPDKTMFILEIRESRSEQSINRGGHFQTGLTAVEAAVKDESRYPGRWTYYNFGFGESIQDTIAPLPETASCYACHSTNTAVEWTFVQFYPTLFEVAKKMGTVKASYDPMPTARH